MSRPSRSAQQRDFQFVNFSSPTEMRDAASKSQIRKHAMKVTGLARRRMKQQQSEGDPIEGQLQFWPSEDTASEKPDATDESSELPGTDVAAATDNETLSSEETASSLRHAASTTLSKPPSIYETQLPELSELDPHWVFEYALHVATSIRLEGDIGAVVSLQRPEAFKPSEYVLKKWTSSEEALMHKTEAIHLVRQRLERLEDNDVEWLIYAILCLARSESSSTSPPISVPFVPYLPHANWTHLYGKTELVDEHLHALRHLVNRQGGLHRLQLPGLGASLALYVCTALYRHNRTAKGVISLTIARTDIQAASTTYHTPMFPKFWSTEVPDLDRSWMYSLLVMEPIGQGFVSQQDVALTEEAVRVFTNLAVVDRILSHRGLHWAKDAEAAPLLNARNAAHYDLLCLPPWHSLDAASKEQSHLVVYELCRLTCLLYSNAVLMGLPPDNGWYKTLIERFARLLGSRELDHGRSLSKILTWSLFIACVAAYELPERDIFERGLLDVLSRSQLTEWGLLHDILREFLWTDAACEMRAKDLWNYMDLEEK